MLWTVYGLRRAGRASLYDSKTDFAGRRALSAHGLEQTAEVLGF